METTRQDAIKVLDNLYDGRIKYELKKLGLLDEGNIPKMIIKQLASYY
jgi:hypothetical protein